MKKLMLACCFVIGAASMSFAQGGQGGQGGGQGGRMGGDPATRAARLKDQLKLTDDQVTKITAIYTADAPKMDSIRKANPDRTTMMAAFTPFMTAEQTKIKAVLTAEQAEAYGKMSQFGGRGGQGGQGGGRQGGAAPATPAPAQK